MDALMSTNTICIDWFRVRNLRIWVQNLWRRKIITLITIFFL